MEFELRAEDGTVTVANSSIISLEDVQLDTPTQSNSLTAGGLAIGVDLIVNGDFENNPVNLDANGNGFGFFDAIEGWTPIFGQIEIQEGANSNSDLGVAGNGVLELATNQNAGVQQTVTVADGADGIFTLSLDHAQRNDDFSPAIFQVVVDGNLVATVTPERGTTNTFTIDLDLDAGDHTIGLIEIGQNNGRGSLIDNVSLVASDGATPPPPPPPPEPESEPERRPGPLPEAGPSPLSGPMPVIVPVSLARMRSAKASASRCCRRSNGSTGAVAGVSPAARVLARAARCRAMLVPDTGSNRPRTHHIPSPSTQLRNRAARFCRTSRSSSSVASSCFALRFTHAPNSTIDRDDAAPAKVSSSPSKVRVAASSRFRAARVTTST